MFNVFFSILDVGYLQYFIFLTRRYVVKQLCVKECFPDLYTKLITIPLQTDPILLKLNLFRIVYIVHFTIRKHEKSLVILFSVFKR